jgi:hypothetical protein
MDARTLGLAAVMLFGYAVGVSFGALVARGRSQETVVVVPDQTLGWSGDVGVFLAVFALTAAVLGLTMCSTLR